MRHLRAFLQNAAKVLSCENLHQRSRGLRGLSLEDVYLHRRIVQLPLLQTTNHLEKAVRDQSGQ
jgi:hypothetical protein